MKVLYLETNYESPYASKSGHIFLPIASMGVFLEELPLGVTIKEKINVGPIEGKHSQCYGSLKIEEIDLKEEDPLKVENLIKNSDYDIFERFLGVSAENVEDSCKDQKRVRWRKSKAL